MSFPPNHKVPSLSCTAERMSCGLLTSLTVSVGYEYESCLDLTLWEKRTAILQGYELDASNMGGWTLDKHHVLDVQNGKFLLTLKVAHPCSDCTTTALYPLNTVGLELEQNTDNEIIGRPWDCGTLLLNFTVFLCLLLQYFAQ